MIDYYIKRKENQGLINKEQQWASNYKRIMPFLIKSHILHLPVSNSHYFIHTDSPVLQFISLITFVIDGLLGFLLKHTT